MQGAFPVSPLLSQAWHLRMNQQNEKVRELLVEIRNALGLSPGQPVHESLSFAPSEKLEDIVSALLLISSLSRLEGDLESCEKGIKAVENWIVSQNRPLPFRLHFEKGLLLHAMGDHSSALELFSQAKSVAQNPAERIYALSNIVFCLENVGAPFMTAYEELRALLGKVDPEEFIGPRAQAEGLEMRSHFREGRLSKVLDAETSNAVMQSAYFKLWVAELPFHRGYAKRLPQAKETFFLASPYLPLKAYRLRTLQGMVHRQDLNQFRATEMADRFYLWTWRWITQNEAYPIESVLALFEGLDLPSLSSRLTLEDYQMVRNGFLWLSFFSSVGLDALESALAALKPVHAPNYLLFDLEEQFVRYLHEMKAKGKDSSWKPDLCHHPLWQSKDIWFREILLAVRGEKSDLPEHLKGLVRSIQNNLGGDASRREALHVDLASFQVEPEGEEKIVSEPMAKGIALIKRSEAVSFQELALQCFGLARFDDIAHMVKVQNLLSRMKKVLPKGHTLFVKSSVAYRSGDWSSVGVRYPNVLCASLDKQEIWRDLLSTSPAPRAERAEKKRLRPASVLKEIRGAVTREEVEKLSQISRSSATRLLAQWVKQGKLKKVGRGKRTRYLPETEV